MNRAEARETLLLYRPGTADAFDPLVAQAIELATRDLELGRWFNQHCAFQKVARAKFQQIQAPASLKTSLLLRGRLSQRDNREQARSLSARQASKRLKTSV